MTTIAPACPPQVGAYPWIPDNGDGTFSNPVLLADYSDPDVVRVGADYYLVSSSFNCTPGLPVLHSRDLVNWTLLCHAVKNLPGEHYQRMLSGSGVWAPAIRHHDGRFWIFFPLPDDGIYLTTAENPAGPWSEPHLVQAGCGLIDPCPLWDDDGKAYLVYAYARSRAGIKDILRISPMAPDGSRLLGEGQVVFSAPERHPTIEGPKFLKRDGWYYILAPAGGVETGWQVALRSRRIFGPYEERIVLEQGSSAVNGPHQGALVDTPNGDWWFVHFQDAEVYGRIMHLQPTVWRDGWPLIGQDYDGNGIGEPVPQWRKPVNETDALPAVPATSDSFSAASLGLQWQWNANHDDSWYSLIQRPGCLRLFAQPTAEDDLALLPNLLMQKFPARAFTLETTLESPSAQAGGRAGLAVVGYHHASLVVEDGGNERRVVLRVDNQNAASATAPSGPVRLRVDVQDGGLCTFLYAASDGGGFAVLGEPFQATKGHWIGARVGLYAVAPPAAAPGAHADFHGFYFHPPR